MGICVTGYRSLNHRTPEKDLECPNTQHVERSMPNTPGRSTTSGEVLKQASQHAFVAILTHNPLHSYTTYIMVSGRSINKIKPPRAQASFYAQDCDSQTLRHITMMK